MAKLTSHGVRNADLRPCFRQGQYIQPAFPLDNKGGSALYSSGYRLGYSLDGKSGRTPVFMPRDAHLRAATQNSYLGF